jgi:hypothetical protein
MPKHSGLLAAKVAAIAMLLLAMGKWPFGFYVLLRWVVCGVCAYSAFSAAEAGRKGWVWVLGILALLFNPFLPVRLGRETWAPVDLAAALLLAVSFFAVDRRR